MRTPKTTLGILAATLATGAAVMTGCASDRMAMNDPAKMGLYQADMERARVACEARGGSLIPSGRNSGQAALDYPCRIHQATAIEPRG